jgi:acyl-[acyl-carrier-protein]-phospholipid O-acyltransferase / long-chain-fatty-acid--[acyl-carrier-protein] ligase
MSPRVSLESQAPARPRTLEVKMSQALLASRRFAPLFWCQFFSAFNDNFLKNALALLILFKIGGQAAESLVTAAGGVFIAPFFLLSALGGELADRFDKASVPAS